MEAEKKLARDIVGSKRHIDAFADSIVAAVVLQSSLLLDIIIKRLFLFIIDVFVDVDEE